MTKQKTHEENMKELKAEIRLLKERRTELDRPTVWYNKKQGLVEIHYNNKTVIARVETVDTDTPREASDSMAQGSNFKEVIYTRNDTTEEEEAYMNKLLENVEGGDN